MAFERGETEAEAHGHRRSSRTKHTGTLITFLPDADDFHDTTEFQFEQLASAPARTRVPQSGSGDQLPRRAQPKPKPETVPLQATASRSSCASSARTSSSFTRSRSCIDGKRKVNSDGSRKSRTTCSRFVLQYNDRYNDQVLCYTNAIPNPDGGTHSTGFRGALTRAINQYAKSNNLLKDKDPPITGDDVREGLAAVIASSTAIRDSSRRPR